MSSKEHFIYLLQHYTDDSISVEQKTVFFEMLETNKYDDLLSSDILEKIYLEDVEAKGDLSQPKADEIFDFIISSSTLSKSMLYKKRVVYIGGALVVLSLLFGVWFYFQYEK